MEDIDLCWRMRLMGYRVLYAPGAVVLHKWGGTIESDSPHRFFLCERNRLRNMIKNYRSRNLAIALRRSLTLDMKIMARFFDQDQRMRSRARVCLKGYLWNLLFLPDTLVWRWRVQRSRVLNDEDVLEIAEQIYGYPGTTGDEALSLFDPPLSVRMKHGVKTRLPRMVKALRAVFPKKA